MKEKQIFPRGCKVHIGDNLPSSISHFKSDFNAIIEYSYLQRYKYGPPNNYSVIQLDKNGQPINAIAWYPADVITLLSDDIEAGKKLIENYHFPD